jgi:VIT1/CCC1 family predicted Fe2+/Mn2+ transporter
MHREIHRSGRAGWLRAAVLGAEDGIVSTASLMIGVAASAASGGIVLLSGVAGMVAGALSMAAGEYVSVSSQRDAARADIAKERHEVATQPAAELNELTEIYVRRGLDEELARKVATRLTEKDALGTHLREELGFPEGWAARPLQAAAASALSFALGAALPLLSFLAAPAGAEIVVVAGTALVSLGVLGALGGYLGGAVPLRGALRVLVGGGLAMGVTALIGQTAGTVV